MNAAEAYEMVHRESGMRYQLQITTSGGPLPTTILHVVVFTTRQRAPVRYQPPEPIEPSNAGPLAKCSKVAGPTWS